MGSELLSKAPPPLHALIPPRSPLTRPSSHGATQQIPALRFGGQKGGGAQKGDFGVGGGGVLMATETL